MIPWRVKLRGFLCYKDEQEVSFDGKSLWMLSGMNGSGKSAIFDAVTYALFGYHRGGSQHAGELINKDTSGMAVEFDFALEGQVYRIRRTLQRNARGGTSATQLISRRQLSTSDFQPSVARDGQGGGWVPLEDTSRKAGFDAWIREHIALSYDTFTSSVLLLQGKADKLLDSTAKGRFEVLAGIVDLEHYEQLHRRADEQRKAHELNCKGLSDRLAAVPEITPEAIREADTRIQTAEAALQETRKEVERWQTLEFQARQWLELQGRLAGLRQRWQQGQQLLAEAAAIESGLARLQELRALLPQVQTVMEQRRQVQESEGTIAELAKQKQKLQSALTQQNHIVEQTVQKWTALQKLVESQEQQRSDLAARFRLIAVQLERVKEYERQQNDLVRLQADLAQLPAQPADVLQRVQEAHDRAAEAARALPLLARLRNQREDLQSARSREQNAFQAERLAQARGRELTPALDRLRPELEAASAARQQADERTTRAHTLYEGACQQLEELTELEGAKVCRHCGQALTPGHLAEEKCRREREVAQARGEFQQTATAQQAAQEQEQHLGEQFAGLEKELQAARAQERDQHSQAEQARREIERLERQWQEICGALPPPFRSQVSAAPPALSGGHRLEARYPTEDDLGAIGEQAAALESARQRLRQAHEAHQRWSHLRGQEVNIQQSLARLQAELPADPLAVRQEHSRLEAGDQALGKTLAACQAETSETHQLLTHLTRERDQTQTRLAELQGRLQGEETACRHYRQTCHRALQELPPPWQAEAQSAGLAKLHAWQNERDELVKQQIETRGRQLQQARAGQEMLRQELQRAEVQQEDFPIEARQDPADLQARLQEARQDQRRSDQELAEARQRKMLLQSYQQQRQELHEQLLQDAKELAYFRLLTELLGRDRLQLHLVRQAERQVVDYANVVLDRLSGGQLYLRLCGEAGGEGNTAKALELEAYNRTTGERPINVAFLSGSQKFRVAVSLALGIGQYASRRHRPIESVIIDEGFGCLDREGRQVMIQELQNLRGHLHCILLVSHQEEFAGAFADGYHFELADGATRVTRFQR